MHEYFMKRPPQKKREMALDIQEKPEKMGRAAQDDRGYAE